MSAWYWSPVARSILSGLALGLAFPPSPVSTLAFIALLPWITVFVSEDRFGPAIRTSYLMIVAYHAVTASWAGGFTHGNDVWMMLAGGALIFIHPLFLLPFVVAAWFVRKHLGRSFGLAALACFWTAYEYFHARGEFSFPWIALGHSQSYDLYRIQIAEFVSVQGLTLHILLFNAFAFLLLAEVSEGRWPSQKKATVGLLLVMTAVYAGPLAYGVFRLESRNETGEKNLVRVGVVQPNIDPWEKWGSDQSERWISASRQIDALDSLTRSIASDQQDLIVWPETAVPLHALLPGYAPTLDRLLSIARESGATILTGLPHARYFSKSDAPVTSRPVSGSSERFVESYNSITTIDPEGRVGPVYAKVVLVPFAERLPHAEALKFLIEPLRWNVGISSWGQGTDTTVFRLATRNGRSVHVGAMICYESAYPQYVREFVVRGAELLVVVTNDSWWGRMPAADQHAAFAAIRAVENRRWLVQAANGGISEVVDPSGRVVRSSTLFERAAWSADVRPESEMTFYVRHGDVLGVMNIIVSGLIMAWAIAVFAKRRLNDDRPEK